MPLEKQCSNGVILCELLEGARPGSVNLSRLNRAADAEHQAIPNYKLLAAGLEKAGVEHPIDISAMAKGTPALHLELLQKLYALNPPQSPAPKGLSNIDPNSLNSDSQRAKRKAPVPMAGSRSKRPALEPSAEEAAPAATTPAAEPAPRIVESLLRAQLEQCRSELSQSRAEASNLREECAFYVQKLELIDAACEAHGADGLAADVRKLLRADEHEVAGKALVGA